MKHALMVLLLLSAQARAEQWLELQLIPVSAQVNVLETEHVGSGGRVTFHFNRFIGVYLGGLSNWHREPSATLDRLWEIQRIDVSRPVATLSTWQLHAGVESIPLTGTFALGAREGEIGLVMTAGLGPGGSIVRLADLTYPDADVRLLGHFGLGMRFAIGAFALHAGVHASMWSPAVTRLNGCSVEDVRAMDLAVRSGRDATTAEVAASCRGLSSGNTVGLALNVLRLPDPTLRVNVAAELGFSWSL